jgi:hypothetical protein
VGFTASSGDTYRIERVYLDGDQAHGFAQDYNGIAPVEPVQVEEWHTGVPPAAYDGPGGPGRHYRMPRWCAGNWPGVPKGGGGGPVAGGRLRNCSETRLPSRGRSGGSAVEAVSTLSCAV